MHADGHKARAITRWYAETRMQHAERYRFKQKETDERNAESRKKSRETGTPMARNLVLINLTAASHENIELFISDLQFDASLLVQKKKKKKYYLIASLQIRSVNLISRLAINVNNRINVNCPTFVHAARSCQLLDIMPVKVTSHRIVSQKTEKLLR